jgi:hypothetical protein
MLYRGIAFAALLPLLGCDASQPGELSAALSRNTMMDAFYDDNLFLINFQELPSGGEAATLAHNGSINAIFQADQGTTSGAMFISVLNAIQGDGFNPLWREVQLSACPPGSMGFPCPVPQFTNDNDIAAAIAARTLFPSPTTEVYRCSVITALTTGPGPKNPAKAAAH